MFKNVKIYRGNCVSSTSNFVNHLKDNSREITRITFMNNVDRNSFKELMNSNFNYYSKNGKDGLTWNNDWYISYHKSKTPKGKICYYFSHSGIEYFFY